MMMLGVITVLSFAVAFFCIPACIKLAYYFDVLDKPDGRLKCHKKITPYLGGLALYIVFLWFGLILFFDKPGFFVLLSALSLLCMLGLIDDIKVLTPLEKFIGQIVAALLVVIGGDYSFQISFLSMGLNQFLSIFWILTLINAFNLIDVMDGLATTVGLGISITLLMGGIILHAPYQVLGLIGALIGALLAFLWYNRPPAQIYLGDAGSLFLGGFVAIMPFMILPSISVSEVLLMGIICAIPLLEVSTLVLIRLYKRIPIYQGSPDHFSIYLKKNGWSIYNILSYCFIVSVYLLMISVVFVSNKIDIIYVTGMAALLLPVWFVNIYQKT